MEEFGIDKLRMCVNWCSWMNETFNQSFTAEELLQVWEYARKHPDWDEFADRWTEEQIQEALRPILKIHIGHIAVHRGEPDMSNPYHGHSLIGDEKKEALRRFKYGEDTSTYTYWYAPSSGGARRITANEVDWETSGV